jgi:3-deoxy-D-manno-octulosonic-acid transferase
MNLLDLLYGVGAVVLAPWWMRKTRGDWRARFGHAGALPKKGDKPRILLHAVSVGEVNALRHLVPTLAERAQVVVSVGTDTGIARARELFEVPGLAVVVRYPIDFSGCVRRFLDAVAPDSVGLVELEVWPNFVKECTRRGVPVAVVNGRLSERSFRGYRRARWFLRTTFARLAHAAVQDAAYRERFVAMGVAPDRCSITGSMKWDAANLSAEVPGAVTLRDEMGLGGSGLLVVAGSTAEDEERLLHEACLAIGNDVRLLCAPRKPEHFDEAAAALPGCVRRSAGTRREGATRFLLDTIGELRKAYALADVVVMGRSFGTLYGSDPIEPAALGKPVVIGPAVKDFEAIVGTMQEHGAIVRTTRERLQEDLRALLCDEGARRALGERALACVVSQKGTSARHAALLVDLSRPR